MTHVCSICNKWVPKMHRLSHLNSHVKNLKHEKHPDLVYRAATWLMHKLELSKPILVSR